jgi:hypothetical protein
MGRLGRDDLVFAMPDGTPRSPDNLSRDWRRAVITLKLPPVMFHALRHTHASPLIAAGLNGLMIGRRLGHGAPAFTLTVYGHLFSNIDAAAAHAIDAAMAGTYERDFRVSGANRVPSPALFPSRAGAARLTARRPTPRNTTANAVLKGAYLPAEGWPSG